jgi:hypothetical protein
MSQSGKKSLSNSKSIVEFHGKIKDKMVFLPIAFKNKSIRDAFIGWLSLPNVSNGDMVLPRCDNIDGVNHR